MKIRAKKIKEWCDQELSPVAWQRIVVQVSPEFRGSGMNLMTLTNPDDSVVLDDAQYGTIRKAIQATYSMQMEINGV